MSDHDTLIRPDLTIDRSALFRIAHRKAAAERAGCLKMAFDKPYARCLSEALRHLWDHIHTRLEIKRMKQQPAPAIDRAAAIAREIELLPYIESHRAAQARRRDLETELAALAA